MKYLSRLTALLLAFVLLFSSSVGVIAESDISDLTRSGYDQMVSAAKEAAEAEAAAAAQEAASQPIINEGGVVYEQDIPEQTKRFDIYEVITDAQLSMGGETEITLPQSGKINLSAGTAAQWQIYIPGADMWVNIAGETGDTFALTYAVIGGMLSGGSAKVRALAGDSAAVANISVAYGSALPPVEEEDTFVAEAAAASTFALRRSASTSDANAGIMLLAEGDQNANVKEKCNIIINYTLENNKVVADPYGATIAHGESFEATVHFPAVPGYLPYVDDERKDSYTFDLESVTEDITINVVYKPTDVNYTVIHYQQDVDSDNYNEVEREVKTGQTNSTVPEVAKTYPGFYSLIYERPAIAANGLTVIEVYYDRYYYLMNFDLGDGGYGTEPIYARYGAALGEIKKPTRAGYTFKGWSLNGTDIVLEMPTTMPAENREYIAVWEADATAKVTIVFWGENADDEEYSYIKSSEINVAPDTEFTYSENGSLICGVKETHTHSAECGYACNQTEHVHTIEDGCYKLICTEKEHNHVNEGCTLSCTHTHELSCYIAANDTELKEISKPSNSLTHRGNGIYTYSDWGTHYVLNIGNKWYCSDGRMLGDRNSISLSCNHSHGDSCYTCGKTQTTHTHSVENGCYELICEDTAHTHTAACGYKCGKTAHEHTSSCYMSGAGMDTNLWKFVKSDTVTVAADGSTVVNVYYDRVEKTLTFKYDYRSYNYQKTETITAKWDADISDEYVKIADNAGSTFWSASYGGGGPYTNYFGIMPETSKTYYNRGTTGNTGTMTYYGEDLNGTYSITLFSVGGVGGYRVTDEDRYEFEGFTYHHGTANQASCSGATFYYTRNSYNLVFNDGYNEVRTESVKYEAPLSTYKDYVPEVPSAYEPGSVTFGGWYLNPECTGVEYKLSEHTMPADNVLLYAKWVPVTRKVNFYLTEEHTEVYQPAGANAAAFEVPHGGNIDETYVESYLTQEMMIAAKPNGDYKFVMWYYKDADGMKHPFDPSTRVIRDMDLYGEWSSDTLKEYTVQFVLKSDHSIKVADDIIGSGLAGKTKTFNAKGDEELYEDYRIGYYPTAQSQSLVLDIDAENLTLIFEYVVAEAVPYTVNYLTKEQPEGTSFGTVEIDGVTYYKLAESYTNAENHKAVVTENFLTISGYMPDAYQKRLVVQVNEDGTPATDKNVINFFYTKDDEHAYYKITHYTQNTDGETWTENSSSEAVGVINESYSAKKKEITGFTFDHWEAVVVDNDGTESVQGTGTNPEATGTLTEDGLELRLYYVRNSYPYQVRYLEQYTDKQLAEPKNGNDLFGKSISENAIGIEYYDMVAPTSTTMTIKNEEGEYNDLKLNVITFYYVEKEVTINYKVVGPTGCGTVDLNGDDKVDKQTEASEKVRVKNGIAVGANAEASSNVYKFVGWYDALGVKLSDDAKYVPTKVENTPWVDGTTYYAKFEYNLTDLTIKKTGLTQNSDDDRESAIFVVTDKETGKEVATIVIPANDKDGVTIDNLTVDKTYVVTEVNAWTWRYDDQTAKEVTIVAPPTKNEVTFNNTNPNPYWLGGDNVMTNVFE